MLEELLRRLAEGGTHSLSELARELGVSERLLRQMIEDLARRGYLRLVADGCETHCAGCPLAETCADFGEASVSSAEPLSRAVGGPTRVWTLTEKGKRAG